MSLFVRVNTSFYGHIKTIKLRARLGNDAFWIPPRIWSIAADQRPDGVFAGVSPEEFALLIGYAGDATSMLQALLHSGFMDEDPLRIHNWDEYNGYHVNYADRARSAAKARWDKSNAKKRDREEKEIEKRREETSNAQALLQALPKHSEEALKLSDPLPTEEELAEEIYKLYPLKVGKPEALVKIRAALKKNTSVFLREKTLAYASAVKGTDTFIPHPATWFHQERYNDGPETWVRQKPQERNENSNRNNPRNGSGRPSPSDERNSEIVGSDGVRSGMQSDRANAKPSPWVGGIQSAIPKSAIAA